MKQILLIFVAALLFFSCKKDDSTTTPTNPGGTTNPYYFKFKLDGVDYNLISNIAQYISSYDRSIGGYQDMAALTAPSIGLELHYDTAVTDAQVKALAGQTLYFNGTNPGPELTFDSTLFAETLYSVDTANTAYSIKVTSVTYLKKDSAVNPVDVYVIKGTCSGVLFDYPTRKRHILTDGDFNFRISRVDR